MSACHEGVLVSSTRQALLHVMAADLRFLTGGISCTDVSPPQKKLFADVLAATSINMVLKSESTTFSSL